MTPRWNRRLIALVAGLGVAMTPLLVPPASAAQTLTWTADDDITRYKSAPATATAGETTIVWENSTATGNTTGMPHTLTFDTSTPGYNDDVSLNILASPFDANDGRHTATVTLTPGKYRYLCTIPGHGTMVGELTVTEGDTEDSTAPTVTGAVTGSRDDDGAYRGSATVTVTATDAGTGVATVEYQVDDTSWQPYSNPVVVSALGDHAVQFRATDRAGNTSTVGSVSFSVVAAGEEDTTAPTVAAQVTGTEDEAGDYVGSVSFTVTAADAGSGVATIEYQLDGGAWTRYTAAVTVNTVGEHMLHFRATDNAGNTSTVGMEHFTIVAPPAEDTTAPVTAATVASAPGRATVTVTASDGDSGVAKVEYQLDGGAWTAYTTPVVVTAAGEHTLGYRATDNAGNTAAAKTVTFTVVVSGTCTDTRDTVIIDGDDTGITNAGTGDGCTINDLIAENATYRTHAAFVRHVETVTAGLVAAGTLTSRQAGTIVRTAARSSVGS
ncbi:OmpL47-type beta-barrel domain-containing protein [Actinoplanes sp. G11-F43]|uniref:OmpL47-type beta-barrel domain-containing protein n=1 Tax=Actinoplanes sp. G11-F43 TaxID=3424130 RepID=UPI003D34FC28